MVDAFSLVGWRKEFSNTGKGWGKYQNELLFQDIFTTLVEIVLNLFEWKGLPELSKESIGCNPLALERTLLFYGKCVFFRHPELGLIHTPVGLSGPINIYGESINRRAFAYDFNYEVSYEESVLIRNTPIMKPTVLTLELWSRKLMDAMRTIEVTAKTYKRPWAVTTGDEQLKTFKSVIKQVDDNETVVFTDKSLNNADIGVFGAPPTSGKLTDLWLNYHNIENLVLGRLGINTANQDKAERQVVDEVNANNQWTKLNAAKMLDWRQLAAEEINKMFGLSCSCELKNPPPEPETGGDNGLLRPNDQKPS